MTIQKVTAGRDALGDFAPKFAQLNDDVLFGEVWSRELQLSPRDRSLITIASLVTNGVFDASLVSHMNKARENGVTKEEIAEVLTHLAFYSGWPKAWAAFSIAKDAWKENTENKT
jgi:4-carboxymuconolactone decarboxylase